MDNDSARRFSARYLRARLDSAHCPVCSNFLNYCRRFVWLRRVVVQHRTACSRRLLPNWTRVFARINRGRGIANNRSIVDRWKIRGTGVARESIVSEFARKH